MDAALGAAFFESADTTKSKYAIFVEATVRATKAQTDSTGTWDIGFIQVFSEPVNIYHFAGLHDTDGSVILDFSDDAYLLDSEKYWFGFTNDSASTSRPDPQQHLTSLAWSRSVFYSFFHVFKWIDRRE